MFLLISALLLVVTGCGNTSSNNAVHFYYCADPIIYGSEDGVIADEIRIVEGHSNSLEFMLNLYLKGPVNKGYSSPFPEGIYVENITKSANRVQITLSSVFSELKGMDITLACACLSKTLQELAQVDYVHISFENSTTGKLHTVTVGPDSFLLTQNPDNSVASEESS